MIIYIVVYPCCCLNISCHWLPTMSEIEIEIEELRLTGMNWTRMANYFGIDRRTLFRWRENLPPEIQLNDEELFEEILDIKREFPHFGEVYVKGALLQRGFIVKRQRIRDCLNVIDGPERRERLMPRRARGAYIVPGVHFIRCIDGNEKCQMFKIYIHGCTDGYSRKALYLKVSDNKRATTVFNSFYQTVLTYGLPRFVRMDRGGENALVRDFMDANINNSALIGSSVRNVRIERLWGEVNDVTLSFKYLFYEMELRGILDVNNPVELFCLHYVFIPRIQNTLDNFKNIWNTHPIRTAGRLTPEDMFLTGEQMPYYPVIHPPELDSDAEEESITEERNSFARSIVPNPLEEDGTMGVSMYLTLCESIVSILIEPVVEALLRVRSF